MSEVVKTKTSSERLETHHNSEVICVDVFYVLYVAQDGSAYRKHIALVATSDRTPHPPR